MSFFKNIKFEQIELSLFNLTILFIPIYKRLVLLFLTLWLIFSFYKIVSNYFIHIKFEYPKSKIIFLFPLFYILHCIGMFYTQNLEYGFFDLEVKFSMLIIPIVIFFRYQVFINNLKVVFKFLILGSIISFFLNISIAIFNYFQDYEIYHFFYSHLSTFIHPSYVALYVSLSIFTILKYKSTLFSFKNNNYKYLYILLLILLSIYLVLLSSKAGIISFLICFFVYLVIKLSKKIKTIYSILASSLIIFVSILIITQVPIVKNRFSAMIVALEKYDEANIDIEDSSMARLAIIKTGYVLSIKNLPFGVGTGDSKDEIIYYYKNLGSKTITENYLNAHNQFFQNAISLGILGMGLLLTILIVGFYKSLKQKNILFCCFIILVFVQLLFESMFEQQAGVIFIILFYSLFSISYNENCIKTNARLEN